MRKLTPREQDKVMRILEINVLVNEGALTNEEAITLYLLLKISNT